MRSRFVWQPVQQPSQLLLLAGILCLTEGLAISFTQVPIVCLGTMTFGEQCDEALSFEIMDAAMARGVNFLDTAELCAVSFAGSHPQHHPACAHAHMAAPASH